MSSSYRNESAAYGMQATVIEEILETIVGVPNAVKRRLELVRELDEKSARLHEEVVGAESAVRARTEAALLAPGPSTKAKKALGDALGPPGALTEVVTKRRRLDALADEKVAITRQGMSELSFHIDVINHELGSMCELLHASGEFEAGAAKADDEVAIRLDVYDEDAWILGRVVRFKPETAHYDVADADDRQIYELPESRVVPLHDGSGRAPPSAAPCSALALDGDQNRLCKGDEVFAVYPDTTSFYNAVVTMPPRRAGTGNAVCHVQFQDDADESGANPDRPIILKYIIRRVQ